MNGSAQQANRTVTTQVKRGLAPPRPARDVYETPPKSQINHRLRRRCEGARASIIWCAPAARHVSRRSSLGDRDAAQRTWRRQRRLLNGEQYARQTLFRRKWRKSRRRCRYSMWATLTGRPTGHWTMPGGASPRGSARPPSTEVRVACPQRRPPRSTCSSNSIPPHVRRSVGGVTVRSWVYGTCSFPRLWGWVEQAACVSTATPTHRTVAEGHAAVPPGTLLSPGWVKQAACVSTAAPTHRTAAEGDPDVAIQCLIQDMLSQASKWSYERTWIRLRQAETPGPPKNTALANSATTSTAACIQDKGQASVAKENRWSCSRRLGI